jgi:tetratricopeptide (TPR) repeat protein
MSDEKLVPFGGRMRRPDPRKLAEFAATAHKLQRERETAASTVAQLLRDTPREQWRDLAQRDDLRTCGALEQLGNLVAQVLGRDPQHALAVAELAASIADTIADDAYPPVVVAQLRAHAWKDVAKPLLYLARFAEAVAAIDRAESHLESFAALSHDRAIVRLVRAAILGEIDRYEESFALLKECKQVFRDHGDTARLILAGISEGVLLHRLRKYREARESYLLLLDSTRESIDRESAACLHNVIGHCSVELGDFESAELYLSRANELFSALGQPLQAAKAELGRGRMLVRQGDIERGIVHLQMTRDQFLRGGLIEEAGICGLDVVEGLLLRDRAPEAGALARRIIEEFSRAGLNKRAITALGYLDEAIAAQKASSATVTQVREYILSLRTCPEREFVAVA